MYSTHHLRYLRVEKMDKKSPRNKTITLSAADRERLQPLVLHPAAPCSVADVENRVIGGDLFEMLDRVPDGVADLIIADPPYNLDKQFGSNSFAARSKLKLKDR